MIERLRPISRLDNRDLVVWALSGLEEELLASSEVERELASVALLITAPTSVYRGLIEHAAARLIVMSGTEETDH